MKRTTAMALGLIAAALATVPEDRAQAAESPGFSQNLCGQQTRLQEQREGIPNNLLTAISLAESGRWYPEHQASIAWPWTVTSGGKGAYFDSKADAIDAVHKLQRAGRTNIDVGCMQINLHYHPEAFDDLDEAFDPHMNVAYAAHFLKALRKDASSWREAAGFYHSIHPERALMYREKLARLSPLANDSLIVEAPDKPSATGKTPDRVQKQIDRLRTAALNAAFRARKAAEPEEDFAAKRSSQLETWREARSDPALFKKLVAAQDYARQRGLEQRTPDEKDDFAAKRRAQLAAWRHTREMSKAAR